MIFSQLTDLLSSWSSKKYIIPVIFISICYNTSKFLELYVKSYTKAELLGNHDH